MACEQALALRVASSWSAAMESLSAAVSPAGQRGTAVSPAGQPAGSNVPRERTADGASSGTPMIISPAGGGPALVFPEAVMGVDADGRSVLLSPGMDSLPSSGRFTVATAAEATSVSVSKLGIFR